MKSSVFLTLAVAGILAVSPLAFRQARAQRSPSSPTLADTLSEPEWVRQALERPADDGLLQALHPDEPVHHTLTHRFSIENSLARIAQINAALDSFRQLTDLSQQRLGSRALANVEHLDWETQNLGFPNWVSSVEGTLRHQDLEVRRLEWELAQKQWEDGEVSQATVEQKAAAYQAALQSFQHFARNFDMAD